MAVRQNAQTWVLDVGYWDLMVRDEFENSSMMCA